MKKTFLVGFFSLPIIIGGLYLLEDKFPTLVRGVKIIDHSNSFVIGLGISIEKMGYKGNTIIETYL